MVEKTVAARPSPQLVVVTSLSLQPTGVATRPPLRAILWCQNGGPSTGWVVTTRLPAAGCGDIVVTSANRGGKTATSTCESVGTKRSPLDSSGGDKTVAARPSPQLVVVTSLSFQPTGVATRPTLRASWWCKNSRPSSGDKTVAARLSPPWLG